MLAARAVAVGTCAVRGGFATVRRAGGLAELVTSAVSMTRNVGPHGGVLMSRVGLAGAGMQLAQTAGLTLTRHNSDTRVGLLAAPGTSFVAGLYAGLTAGASVVPLCVSHPPGELSYTLEDARPSLLFVDEALEGNLDGVRVPQGTAVHVVRDSDVDPAADVDFEAVYGQVLAADARASDSDPAVVVYTSGTTGRPKGAVVSRGALAAQINTLVGAWRWSPRDAILNVLPLHHVHGLVNVVACALASDATLLFQPQPRFDPAGLIHAVINEDVNLVMGVPTVYSKMLDVLANDPDLAASFRSAAEAYVRLMVCGSAALPVPVLEAWRDASGHILLERMGMTEFGMALSNPLTPPSARRPGWVGTPLPGVRAALRSTESGELLPESDPGPGELLIASPGLFSEYLNKPQATAQAFTSDGFFATGDAAVRDVDTGEYAIQGRLSVDILKVSGYKVSALDVERTLLGLTDLVRDVAVVGVPDPVAGQAIVAVLEPGPAASGLGPDDLLDALRARAAQELASYKMPSRVVVLDEIPRNTQGKVSKTTLVQELGLVDDNDGANAPSS